VSLPPRWQTWSAAALVTYGRRWRAAREPGLVRFAERFGWFRDR
jgi:hypothetical protein